MNVSSVAGAMPVLKKPEAQEAPGPEVGASNDHDGDEGAGAASSGASPRPGTGTVVNTSA